MLGAGRISPASPAGHTPPTTYHMPPTLTQTSMTVLVVVGRRAASLALVLCCCLLALGPAASVPTVAEQRIADGDGTVS